MTERTQVQVFGAAQYDDGFPPGNLVDFRDWLNRQIALVPAEFLDTAEIKIDTLAFYESPRATVNVTYKRPLTAEEKSAGVAAALRQADIAEEAARLQYEELKKRFG